MILRYLRLYDFRGPVSVEGGGPVRGTAAAAGSGVLVVDIAG